MLPISDFKLKNKKKNRLLAGSAKVKVIFVFVMLLTGLVFTQLVFANNLATDGQKLSHIREKIRNLEDENTTLRAEIAQTSSLTNLSKEAQKLGFKKPSKLTIL